MPKLNFGLASACDYDKKLVEIHPFPAFIGNKKFFLTHGHLWNEWKLPPIGIADVLVHGHTHVPELKTLECGMTIFNPGSVSLPKGGSSRSFGYYDGENLKHYVI